MESLRPAYPAPRRVATAPIPSPASRITSVGGLVETLYNHPNVKIVSFSATSRGRARSPGRGPADEPGTLSAYSQLERTIAIGPFRIYRTGSVAFLNCGSALQPMLPKSQCWALEEDSSKFVLQIRRPSYWRIEIPVTDPTEQELATALRGVLDQILQFEKTECPFQRSFTITLPEKPKTPVKKRPWTPPVKGALPVLSTPAHEVSPTTRTASTRRASTSLAVRGRTEQRRFSVIGTEFQSGTVSRETSTETSRSFEPPRDHQPTNEALAIPEEKTEPEQRAGGFVAHETKTAPRLAAQEVIDEGNAIVVVKLHADQTTSIPDDLIEDETIVEETKRQAEVAGPADTELAGSFDAIHVHCNVSDKAKSDVVAGKEPESSNIEFAISSEPAESDSRSSLTPLSGIEACGKNERTKSNTEEISSSRTHQKPHPNNLMIPKRLKASTDSVTQPQIKEQLVTVVVPPKTPSSIEAGTPTPTNIYDVIRNYEQKMATAVPELTDVIDESPAAVAPQSEAADGSDPGSSCESRSGTDGEAEILEGSGIVGGRRKKLRGFRAGRALVPPQLTLVTSPPTKSAMRQTPILEEAVSPTGSADSFHSVQSWHSPGSPVTPVPRSPASDVSPTRFPYPHDNIMIPKRPWHYRDISDMTVTPETRRTWDATSSVSSSLESAATAPDIASEVVEQPDKIALSEDEAATTAVTRRPYIRHRATTSSISVGRRALTPLPPATAATLFAPTATTIRQPFLRSRLEIVRRIPMAIVSKTCEVLLGPPSHLITLMLQVAAKIAAGQWRGVMFGYGEGGETIPVQWDYSDDEYSSWGEDDDYYLSQVESSRANSVIGGDDDRDMGDEAADGTGRGWEVD